MAGGGIHGVTPQRDGHAGLTTPELAIYTTGPSVVARALDSGEVI